ncbi:MAG TPA: DUF6036 family nucleotidyltransferase [Micromonosporaceae bacterium]|nr:DUF6036 family nucleotidyltransferase [Micromonosporaceae bacterium]
MNDEPLLDRDTIDRVFHRLGERLASRGVVADLYVFGGAAMAVAYDARRATRDIDALFVPHGVVLAEARAVAEEFGLPAWWLNDQASTYVARDRDLEARTVFEHRGLRVQAASPKHLLAMKVLAARRRDAEDIKILVGQLGLASPDEVLTLCADIFPEEPVPGRARLLLEDMFREE